MQVNSIYVISGLIIEVYRYIRSEHLICGIEL